MKKFITSLVIAVTLGLGIVASPAVVYAGSPADAAKSQVCGGVNGTAAGSCSTGGGELSRIVTVALNILSIIAGAAAVIMIIISGMKYVTSSGDSQAVAGAKRTLIYAVVGLVVVAMAQFIVRFVLSNI